MRRRTTALLALIALLLALPAAARGEVGCRGLARRAPPTARDRAFAGRTREIFAWIRALSRRAIPVCEVRVRFGDSAWQIGKRLGIPLWALERVNRGRDLSRLRAGEPLRLPAVRAGIARHCFTPVRRWLDEPGSGPPFWW